MALYSPNEDLALNTGSHLLPVKALYKFSLVCLNPVAGRCPLATGSFFKANIPSIQFCEASIQD